MPEQTLSPERLNLLVELCQKLGVTVSNLALLNEALTHSSYRADHQSDVYRDYERMEFFGDAVLKFVVSEYLFRRFENYAEGRLTEIRAVLVSGKMLEELGESVDLGKYILLGRRAVMRGSILSRSMEAILGALYLDSGFSQVTDFIISRLAAKVAAIHQDASVENYKARLQIFTQAKGLGVPVYEVVSREGPAHAPTFEIAVLVAGVLAGKGQGTSKKEAEQKAAMIALDALAKP